MNLFEISIVNYKSVPHEITLNTFYPVHRLHTPLIPLLHHPVHETTRKRTKIYRSTYERREGAAFFYFRTERCVLHHGSFSARSAIGRGHAFPIADYHRCTSYCLFINEPFRLNAEEVLFALTRPSNSANGPRFEQSRKCYLARVRGQRAPLSPLSGNRCVEKATSSVASEDLNFK